MDFDAPLGMGPQQRSRRPLVLAAVGCAVLLVLGAGAALLATADPHGGEPFAIANLPPLQAKHVTRPTPAVDATPTGSLAVGGKAGVPAPVDPSPFPGQATVENGVKVFRGTVPDTHSASNGPLVIDVTKSLDAGKRQNHVGDPGLATAASAPALPRVAIFVEAMGANRAATQKAMASMPAGVTFAFLPYGNEVAGSVAAAKAKGHEILLQVPMQNAGGTAPGPHALRPDEGAAALAGDLEWLTSRFSGYDGLVNLLGGPVTANGPTMKGLLRMAAARNLFFVDDGTSKRSLASSLAAELKVPAVQADLVLDATSDPAVVQANLDQLVAIARRKGKAVGMASGLPEHLDAIARFAAGLGGQHVSLVPVSALVRDDANVAAATR